MSKSQQRPQRLTIQDELGRPRTLAHGLEQFDTQGGGQTTLVLGVGPEPGEVAAAVGHEDVYYMEPDAWLEQMPAEWNRELPRSWTRLKVRDLTPRLVASSRILIHKQALRLFSSFWGPILARVRLILHAEQEPEEVGGEIWMPATSNSLLTGELGEAFSALGFGVRWFDPGQLGKKLLPALAKSRPRAFFCVNFKGLDPHGEQFHLLREAGVPVVVWCVDNPFNLISGLRSPFWKQAHLCVTDSWFLDPLHRHGARRLLHLPLACWPRFFAHARPEVPDIAKRLVFVGRSRFPARDKFFAGQSAPEVQTHLAANKVRRGQRPDYAWWLDNLAPLRLWPGNQARAVGYATEETSRFRRAYHLKYAARENDLTVFGDEQWPDLVPGITDARGPVDYYTRLPGIYASAEAVLNVTSLLLPHGLTQRHFDVWAAGGFLVTDDTPGLDLFPEELTRDIRFEHPRQISAIIKRMRAKPELKEQLTRAWKEEILAHHTYAERMRAVLDWVDSRPGTLDHGRKCH